MEKVPTCVCGNIDMVALKRERERERANKNFVRMKKSAELEIKANKNCISQMKINQQFE